MKKASYSKIKEILASSPDDAELFREAGLLDQVLAEEQAGATTSAASAKYYDLNKIKQEIPEEVSKYDLKDLEVEPGKYELSYDYLGTLETACRTFGLEELGIEESDNGYKLGDQEAGSIDELEFAPEVFEEYAEKVAKDLNERIRMPGLFHFGINPEWGDGAYRLLFDFTDEDVPKLQEMGAKIQPMDTPSIEEQPTTSEASFDQILSALEEEGCHDIALKLHSILREN